MKKLLNKLDEWAAKAIQLVRPGKHKTSNVLTDDVHIKERQVSEEDESAAYEQERVILPDQYYVTRTGQTMRKPVKTKKYYKRYGIGNKK